eukprot:2276649-Rhodomonas_salina.1
MHTHEHNLWGLGSGHRDRERERRDRDRDTDTETQTQTQTQTQTRTDLLYGATAGLQSRRALGRAVWHTILREERVEIPGARYQQYPVKNSAERCRLHLRFTSESIGERREKLRGERS